MKDPLSLIHPRNIKHLNQYIHALVEGRLWLKIIIGLILGSITGFLLGPDLKLIDRDTAKVAGEWLALPGQFFLALIQMIVIPLVFASVISGLASGESVDQLKKMGSKVVIYFLFTSIVAVIIGVSVASFIKPGNYIESSQLEKTPEEVSVDKDKLANSEVDFKEIPSAIVSAIPKNPLNEMVQSEMFKIVIFSIIVGLALISLKPKQSRPLLNLLGSIQSVTMKIVGWAMQIAPLAVFGLIAQLTIQTGLETLTGIGFYVITVLAALFIMLCFYLLIALVVGKWSPWNYLSKIKEAQLLAFSTDSSVATMPLSIKTAQEKLKVRPSISQFIIPVGATVNMDATALFQGAATIFIAQVYNLELGIGTLLVLVATAVGSSIGTPATPGVGIIVLSAVLKSVGVPLEGLALIIGVDRILEMFRTSINVSGDLTASVVMEKLVKGGRSYKEEIQYHKELEKKQEETGEHVIVGEVKPKNNSMVHSFFDKITGFFNHDEEEGKGKQESK